MLVHVLHFNVRMRCRRLCMVRPTISRCVLLLIFLLYCHLLGSHSQESVLGSLREVVALSQTVDDPRHTQTVRYLLVLGRFLFQYNQYDDAIPVLRRAIDLSNGAYESREDVAGAMSNLAFCYLHLKVRHKFTETLTLLAQSVHVLSEIKGDLHLCLLPSLLRYARLFETNGRYAQVCHTIVFT